MEGLCVVRYFPHSCCSLAMLSDSGSRVTRDLLGERGCCPSCAVALAPGALVVGRLPQCHLAAVCLVGVCVRGCARFLVWGLGRVQGCCVCRWACW